MSLLVEFAMFPTDQGESVGDHVTRLAELIDQSGLPYKLGPMGTTLEGEPGPVFELLQRCLQELQKDTHRVSGFVQLDWRAGREDGLREKVASVTQRAGHKFST